MDHVRVEPLRKKLTVRLGPSVIADSAAAFAVHEGSYPIRYYVPRDDIRAVLSHGQGEGVCPWKGKWRHLDVTVDGQTVSNAGWSYHETTTICGPITDHVAFYPDKLTIELG